jgi:hypothetical protein
MSQRDGDGSLARSAWKSVTPKEPSRRVRCDSRRRVHRFRFGDNFEYAAIPDHTVPYGTVLAVDAFPSTSCQATIMLSLCDEIHSPAEALIKLALMGLKTPG